MLLAKMLVEKGQTDKLFAKATRQINRNFDHLQASLITLPRFIQTVQHYMAYGMMNPFANFGKQ